MADFFVTFYVKTAFGISYPITNILYCVGIPFLLSVFDPSVRFFIRRGIECAAVWAANIVLSSLLFMGLGMNGNLWITYIVYPLLLTAYSVFCSNNRVSARIIYSCVYFSTIILSLGLSEAIGFLFRSIRNDTYDFSAVVILVNIVMISALIVYFKCLTIEKEKYIHPLPVVIIVAISAVSSMMHLFGLSSKDYGAFIIFISVSLWLIDIMMYYMLVFVTRYYNANMELVAENQLRRSNDEMLKVSEQNYENMREVRHEIKNQFSMLKILIETKQYDGLLTFFESMQDKLFSSFSAFSLVDCGNRIINLVLNLETAKARANNVTLETKLAVPKDLPFTDSDICSLLTNLIDNAIEASVRDSCPDPVVEVGIRQLQQYLFLRVTNPIGEKTKKSEILKLKTSKADEAFHGCGTKIVAKIADSYAGAVKYDIIDGRFVADIMLQLSGSGDGAEKETT